MTASSQTKSPYAIPGGRASWRAECHRRLGRSPARPGCPARVLRITQGYLDGIKDAFGETLRGSIDRVPVGELDLTLEDGVIVSLFRQALVRCLQKAENLASAKGKGHATQTRVNLFPGRPARIETRRSRTK